MAGQAPADSGRELHGDELEQALEAQREDLGERGFRVPAGSVHGPAHADSGP
jgi:hypothetical protein